MASPDQEQITKITANLKKWSMSFRPLPTVGPYFHISKTIFLLTVLTNS